MNDLKKEETEEEQILNRIAALEKKATKVRKELADLEWSINFEKRQLGGIYRQAKQKRRDRKAVSERAAAKIAKRHKGRQPR